MAEVLNNTQTHSMVPVFEAMRQAGVDPAPLTASNTAHLVAFDHSVISRRGIPGLDVQAETVDDEIRISVTVREGIEILHPVHLCIGLLEQRGIQKIRTEMRLEAESSVSLLAHCLFTRPLAASHLMDATISLAAGARLHYNETHFHGQSGGIDVRPHARIRLESGAQLFSRFALVVGRVGQLDIDYDVDVGTDAIAELTSKVYGRGTDRIRIRERLVLSGANARGLIKSRIAATDDAVAEVSGITEGNAAGARGHVDCMEIVRDRAHVSASPMISVSHPQAKVTHEAAIGSVDHQQLETLMARGLTPEAAVDLIVSRLLGQP